MGVEKSMSDARSKSSSVDLYRPPALRNHNVEIVDTKSASAASNLDASSTTPTPTATSISCNSSPIHANENCNFDKSATSTCVRRATPHGPTAKATATATTLPSPTASEQQSKQQQPTTRQQRERRPDRAVYIPRARRSQTTPPTTTAVAESTIATPSTSATTKATTSCNNASSNQQQQQLQITSNTTAPVATSPSTKTDEIVGKSVSKKSKAVASREHRERVKKSSSETQETKASTKLLENPIIEDQIATLDVLESGTHNSIITHLNCDNAQLQGQQKEQNKAILTPLSAETAEILSENLSSPKVCVLNADHQITTEIFATIEMNTANSGREKCVEMPNLRIEDVASNENARDETKCDIEEQEFQRASKEINRSNRRIIKQTFVSDILEIPERINDAIKGECTKPKVVVSSPSSSMNIHSAVDSTTEEEEEDDWETMYDDSGECLDPKIMQELTASVGKVKIELPKMDYTAYLSKQSILNEEEFPHVLEVSNFPVEFKNQDLLMVFSQYKESGFDIKWVDDTHALAVFSSSRIAAEVLTMGHPFVVLKPLAEATTESRLKAKKCAASLQPYRQRPETCAALARRLVTGALGVRLKTAAAERENEKRVLREAKERKLLAAKQRDEAWES